MTLIWVGDSLLARPRHEPLTLLAGVAGRTDHVKLGTAILIPALRNPVVMAHQIATLDQVSDGRTIIGVGIAANVPNVQQEFKSAGVPWEKRVGRMLEGLRLFAESYGEESLLIGMVDGRSKKVFWVPSPCRKEVRLYGLEEMQKRM